MIYRTMEGETLDSICWRYYGRTEGVLEQVLNANYRLADLGAILPQGTLVELPEIAAPEAKGGVSLWG